MSISDIQGFDDIRDLNADTVNRIFQQPDKLALRINQVASEVINRFEPTPDVNKFCKSLVTLNNDYKAKLSITPFDKAIKKIETSLKDDECKKLEKQFKDKINNLDLSSPKSALEIQDLFTLLNKLEQKGGITKQHRLAIEGALDSLRTKGCYKETLFETRAWKTVARVTARFQTAIEKAAPLILNTDKEGQRLMLNVFKKSNLSLSELAKTIPNQTKQIQKKLMGERLDAIRSKIPSETQAFNSKNFIPNFISLVDALENFSLNIAIPSFEKGWAELSVELNKSNNGEFSKLLKYYPYMNPEDDLPEWVSDAEIKYTGTLKVEDLCSIENTKFNEKIIEMNEKADRNLPTFFANTYSATFLDEHVWLANNCSAVKKPYNQAEDTNRNQGEGTCYQNSLERYNILLSNPHKDGTKIEMGSTSKGRMLKATVNQAFQMVASLDKVLKIQSETANKLGLVSISIQPITHTDNIGEDAVQWMDKTLQKQKGGVFILALYSPDSGHAMNVQINPQLGIYRFIDDNLGICEWDSYPKFREEFKSYLDAFYGEYDEISLETYGKKSTNSYS